MDNQEIRLYLKLGYLKQRSLGQRSEHLFAHSEARENKGSSALSSNVRGGGGSSSLAHIIRTPNPPASSIGDFENFEASKVVEIRVLP